MEKVEFNDKNSYELKDEIKLNGGIFNNETKTWFVPRKRLQYLKQLSEEITKNKIELWKKACDINNIKFVKKDYPEYASVLETFKELCKEGKTKEN